VEINERASIDLAFNSHKRRKGKKEKKEGRSGGRSAASPSSRWEDRSIYIMKRR